MRKNIFTKIITILFIALFVLSFKTNAFAAGTFTDTIYTKDRFTDTIYTKDRFTDTIYTKDTSAPKCSSWSLNYNPTKDEVTLNLSGVSDDTSIANVMVAVWTSKNGQDDLIWNEATNLGNGKYKFTFNTSQHNNEEGIYNVHTYINDGAGHSLGIPQSITVDKTAPTYSSCKIDNQSIDDKMTVNLTGVSDNYEIDRVMVAVWTSAGGQDDLKWSKATNLGNGRYSFTFNRSEHNYEEGTYNIHCYIYDKSGNACGIANSAVMKDYFGEFEKRITLYSDQPSNNQAAYTAGKNHVKKLPNKVINLINTYIYKLEFVGSDIDFVKYINKKFDCTYKDNTIGLCSYGPKTMYVDLDWKYSCTYHEFGHAVDNCLGIKNNCKFISNNRTFQNCYNTEQAKMFPNPSSHYRENVREYFAECYYYFLVNPDYLKQKAPNTYNFINNLQY